LAENKAVLELGILVNHKREKLPASHKKHRLNPPPVLVVGARVVVPVEETAPGCKVI
jgi:hypothetical protein